MRDLDEQVMREFEDLVNKSKVGSIIEVSDMDSLDAILCKEYFLQYSNTIRFLGYSPSEKVMHLTRKINVLGDYVNGI